jgi:hypothetical protein
MRSFEREVALAGDSDCPELNADDPGACVCANEIPRPEILKNLETLQQ